MACSRLALQTKGYTSKKLILPEIGGTLGRPSETVEIEVAEATNMKPQWLIIVLVELLDGSFHKVTNLRR